MGSSVAVLGDVDGDGLADRAIGAYGHDPAGAVYVHLSSEGGHTLVGTDTIDGLKWIGEVDVDQFGFAVAAGGDLNGDGLADLIVGAHDNDSGGIVAGAAYLLLSDGELTDRDTVGDRVVADCKLIGEAAGTTRVSPSRALGTWMATVSLTCSWGRVGRMVASRTQARPTC
ncbi:MAG: FG-GAP repeat protein [Deltaproteobacteria bacterium]|nr:FG-GAP repeat protein [Deltaproteobacteria bacterium]